MLLIYVTDMFHDVYMNRITNLGFSCLLGPTVFAYPLSLHGCRIALWVLGTCWCPTGLQRCHNHCECGAKQTMGDHMGYVGLEKNARERLGKMLAIYSLGTHNRSTLNHRKPRKDSQLEV